MSYVLLSVSGRDRPGIVRDLSESLLHLNANIEDSSMTTLRGSFVMMLIVHLVEGASISGLRAALADLEQRTGLAVQSWPMTDEDVSSRAPDPDCMVTVSGADKPGIVHAVTAAMAAAGNSIVDLSTRTVHDGNDEEKYTMVLGIVSAESFDALKRRLGSVAKSINVEIEAHPLETSVL